jgi:OmpA-like transmembrane domain
MPVSKLQSITKPHVRKLSAVIIALTMSCSVVASEGGFIGVYGGGSSSLDADSTGSTFKILTGAHITSRLTLEFGYVNFGATSYDDPSAINLDNNNQNISFNNAEHGSITFGQLGDATIVDGGKNTYDAKGSAEFNGISEFTPEGALINFRYRFPMLDTLDFFVKTGFFAWVADYKTIKITAEQNATAADLTPSIEKSSQTSGVNAISGAGFIYRPIPQLSLRTELESTAISSAEMPRTRLQNIAFGINWEF